MQIRYVGPADSVAIVADGLELVVKRGETVNVSDAVAGSAPSPAFLKACAALAAAANAIPRDHDTEAAARVALVEVTAQSGSGLLEQHETWVPVAPKSPKGGE